MDKTRRPLITNGQVVRTTQGGVDKCGQNPANTNTSRPPAPQGSGARNSGSSAPGNAQQRREG